MLTHNVQVKVNSEGDVLHRRHFLRNIGLGAAALGGGLTWMDSVRASTLELRKQGMACILLFMRGGPSQFETFDPKPGTDTGGPTKAISTAVPGIQIAQGWEQTAKIMKEMAIIRSMTAKEGNHQRAVYQAHTGYAPSGSVKYPSIGSIVSREIADPTFDLPSYVNIGGGIGSEGTGSGFLGASVAPFVIADPTKLPANVALPGDVSAERLKKRLSLMDKLSQDFAENGGKSRVADQKALYQTATSMVLSPRMKAFDVSQEKETTKERYGKTTFGQGCLLARRLVETGVTFVEVVHGNWDTHDDNFNRVGKLAGEVDKGMSALIEDLKQKGMLERTLVIWMGEFGRTPTINPRTGRDHYPRAFNVALAGGGVKGGQVIGSTDKAGREVKEEKVEVLDLFCSFYHALKIEPKKENMSGVGRPIKLVDGGQYVKKLFG